MKWPTRTSPSAQYYSFVARLYIKGLYDTRVHGTVWAQTLREAERAVAEALKEAPHSFEILRLESH